MSDRILDLAEDHVLWSGVLVELGISRNQRSASRMLSKLQDRREIRFFGRCRLFRRTKPFYGYTNANLKRDNVEHEFLVSFVAFLCMRKGAVVRRGQHVDQSRLPDLESDFPDGEGVLGFDWEIDCSTMNQTKVRRRLRKHLGSRRNVMIVTKGRPLRRDNLIESARREGIPAYAATFEDLRTDPFGCIWKDTEGVMRQMTI